MWGKRRMIAVCARMGDPLYQEAKARLIWAAQTAQATKDVGSDVVLVGSGSTLPIKVEGPEGVRALRRLVSDLYNVEADFEIMPLYGPATSGGLNYGDVEANELFPRYVLPYVDLVHTRDPRIVKTCISAGIPVIYEDHNEDYHLSETNLDFLNQPMVRAVVAITTSVASRLELLGVARSKIVVQDSGVNRRALQRFPVRAEAWRRSLLGDGRCDRLVAYSGGLQTERGIAHIMKAALHMPDVMFALAGGYKRDIAHWLAMAKEFNLLNVRFLKYLPQAQAIELQQAADAVLMTREPGARGAISSPLKYFEYLASGTPVVSAATAVLREKDTTGLASIWYDPEVPETLVERLRELFKTYPRRIDGYAANIEQARQYTWQERQKKILSFAMPDAF